MMHRNLTLLAAAALSATAAVLAQGPADEQAIREAAAAYAAAFNKKDITAYRALWVETGEFIDESGKRIRGREALVARIREYLEDNPRDTLKIIEAVEAAAGGWR